MQFIKKKIDERIGSTVIFSALQITHCVEVLLWIVQVDMKPGSSLQSCWWCYWVQWWIHQLQKNAEEQEEAVDLQSNLWTCISFFTLSITCAFRMKCVCLQEIPDLHWGLFAPCWTFYNAIRTTRNWEHCIHTWSWSLTGKLMCLCI